MTKKPNLRKRILCLLLVAFVSGAFCGIYADGFSSETSGISDPHLMYYHHVMKLAYSIEQPIRSINLFNTKLKDQLCSEDFYLLVSEGHAQVRKNMGQLRSALKDSPYPDPNYPKMLNVLEAAIQADSAFEEDPAKRDVEYWKKRISLIESILRPCSEFGFTPVSGDEKPQQENNGEPPTNEVADRANRNLGLLWVLVPSIIGAVGILVAVRLRRTSK